jgi:predicted enzyme related to lactoylglutathione lyase
MANVDSPQPGSFCWIELATSDPVAAKEFYSSVFGWSVRENDMGEMGIYYVFQKNERDCAAMYKLMPDQASQGVPPNWTTYVGVTSADATVEQAKSLGATILAGPFDVYDLGRMAMIQDPEGAVFALWEAKKNYGVRIRDEANTLCWNELATRDPDRALKFYTTLFGWTPKVSPEYTEWHLDGKGIGGMRTIGEGEPTPPNWLPYFLADDCTALTERVKSAGGHVIVPANDMAGVGRFSVDSDPQGAFFSLYQPLR